MHLGRGCAKKYKETKKPKQSETQIFNFSKTIVKSVFAFVITALSNMANGASDFHFTGRISEVLKALRACI